MILAPEFVLIAALSVAISGFSVFNLIFERSFVKRYGKFKNEFEKWRKKEINDFYNELKKKMKKLDSKNFFDFVDEWAKRQEVINELPNEHHNIQGHIRWSLGVLFLAALSSIWALFNPDAMIGSYLLADVGLGFLGLGIVIIFWCIYDYYRLSARIMSYELGTPIEDVVEDYIEKSKNE